MPDNVNTGDGVPVATKLVTHSGDADKNVQVIELANVAGSEGSRTVEAVTGTIGAAVPAAAVQVGGKDGSGNLRAFTTDTDGDLQLDVKTLPALAAGANVIGQVFGGGAMPTADITRPADTNTYAVNDAWSDSTTAPTTGGFTLANAARVSGGAGILTDLYVATSADPALTLQGEILIFDRAVTNVNDNAAWVVTDAEIKTLVGRVSFTMEDMGNNGWFHAGNLGIFYVCNGSADLRFLVRVKNAYVPVSAEVLTVTAKCLYVN